MCHGSRNRRARAKRPTEQRVAVRVRISSTRESPRGMNFNPPEISERPWRRILYGAKQNVLCCRGSARHRRFASDGADRVRADVVDSRVGGHVCPLGRRELRSAHGDRGSRRPPPRDALQLRRSRVDVGVRGLELRVWGQGDGRADADARRCFREYRRLHPGAEG